MSHCSRRTMLSYAAFSSAAVAGGSVVAGGGAQVAATSDSPNARSSKRYEMKKSINQWAFPYPQKMSLRECLQLAKDAGFDGIELNYDLENDLSLSGEQPIMWPFASSPMKSGFALAVFVRSCSGRIRSPAMTRQKDREAWSWPRK